MGIKYIIDGQPNFETLGPYLPKGLYLKQLGKFRIKFFLDILLIMDYFL